MVKTSGIWREIPKVGCHSHFLTCSGFPGAALVDLTTLRWDKSNRMLGGVAGCRHRLFSSDHLLLVIDVESNCNWHFRRKHLTLSADSVVHFLVLDPAYRVEFRADTVARLSVCDQETKTKSWCVKKKFSDSSHWDGKCSGGVHGEQVAILRTVQDVAAVEEMLLDDQRQAKFDELA